MKDIAPTLTRPLHVRNVHTFTPRVMRRPDTIAAFSARGRELAYAVLEGGELVRFGLKTIRARRDVSRCAKAVESAVRSVVRDSRAVVVIENCDGRRRPGRVCKALGAINSDTERTMAVEVSSVPLDAAKVCLCKDRSAALPEIVEAVLHRYPVLTVAPEPCRRRVAMALAVAQATRPPVPRSSR